MKKYIIFIMLILISIAIAVLFSHSFFSEAEETAIINNINIQKETPLPQEDKATAVQINPHKVDSERLFADVQKLSFQRFTASERRRTRDYITSELKKMGWEPILEQFPTGINVFAEKQGRDRNAGAILIAAHYDTVFKSPGADDNASGVAVLLEIARLFSSASTPRTLQLAFFDKEEAGLLGSRAFVDNEARLQNLRGVIVMDMVGYACYTSGCQKSPSGFPITPTSDKGDFLAVVGDTEHLPLLNAFKLDSNINNLSQLPPVFTLPVPLKGVLTPDVLRSDHAPFWLQGIGALLVTDTANLRSSFYHQSSDTPTNIERDFFAGAAQLIVNVTDALLSGSGSLETPS
ncbi:M20/M25/M40 family metallo-hydrolase [Rivularia sp. UHCC 0363]|uniref:M20/M25/M40 family metallo-hydrolase n=1 Tax=Rivularia sp. UHCC 0363 TaxID=3110244 RepID=UPI002B1F2CBC|nr:M20/M25/M40 family metallo-hydrolase [Rivularia sp. UHCC 0363]MEA5597312.1 M20/M25/M40 family metallo-hydrolase [Rivularia sp. UHCC 0363]